MCSFILNEVKHVCCYCILFLFKTINFEIQIVVVAFLLVKLYTLTLCMNIALSHQSIHNERSVALSHQSIHNGRSDIMFHLQAGISYILDSQV